MRMRSCLSSVVLAVASVSLTPAAHAVDLVWDMDPATAGVQDGNGTWDLTALNWVNAGSNGAWINGSNAVFGSNVATASNLAPYNVSLGAAIVVQDLRLNGGTATGALGQVYSIDDDAGGSLQLNGNVIKNSAGGNPLIRLANGLTLGAGNHVFTLRDTGGDALPELRIQGVISGSGSVTLDNSFGGSGYESWGGLNFTRDNTYTGQTFISDGRLGITRANGLGASGAGQGTIINAIGTLAIGGGGQLPTSNLTINEPITVSRSAYTGAFDNGAGITGDAGTYNSAIFTYNGSGTTTFNDLTVDSNDVRLRAETSTLVVANNIKIGPNATTPSISVTGDFAGFVHLTGNNTALTGGVSIISSVQLDVDNDNQIGGASAPLNFVASGTYHPVGGYATSFGTHVLNNATFNGGINVDDGKNFDINQPLGRALGDDTNRVGSLGKRGTGTLNINAAVNLRGGQTYWDGGIVNVNTPIELANLHLRSPIVNIGTGTSITTIVGYSSFGEASTGTNGGPDIAVMNLTGDGKFIQNQNEDLNISDLANTQGTINISGTAELRTAGLVHLGRNLGAVGTINQSGGTINVNRTGNFAFILGRDNGKGVYNLSGGAWNSVGEAYVGQGHGTGLDGHGQWNQTGGTATISNWFVVGREGSAGDVDISGGTFIKKGGGNTPIGEGTNTRGNSWTTRGTGTTDFQTGEVWVSNGTTTTTMNIQDTATVNGNNYFVIGRFGGSNGILNLSGGSLNHAGTNPFIVAAGGGSTGLVTQTGGAFNDTSSVASGAVWVSDGGNATWNVSGGTVSALQLDVGHNGGGSGTMTISGTAAVNATTVRIGEAGTVVGTLNLSGGSLKAGTVVARNSTGAKTFAFTGGTLSAGTFSVGSELNNTGTGIVAPGGVATAGTTAITGGYTQGATAATTLDFVSAASNDAITATGAVALDGTLNLNRVAAYVGGRYQPVTVVSTTGALTGHYATVNGVSIDADRSLAVTYTANSVVVTVALPGDATVNGTVNFDDLINLAQNYNKTGKTWVDGDFTGNGIVNFDDLIPLAQHYNTSALPGSLEGLSASFQADWALAQSLVPEPTSLSLLGLGAAAMIRRRK